jgi:hypothetical protein
MASPSLAGRRQSAGRRISAWPDDSCATAASLSAGGGALLSRFTGRQCEPRLQAPHITDRGLGLRLRFEVAAPDLAGMGGTGRLYSRNRCRVHRHARGSDETRIEPDLRSQRPHCRAKVSGEVLFANRIACCRQSLILPAGAVGLSWAATSSPARTLTAWFSRASAAPCWCAELERASTAWSRPGTNLPRGGSWAAASLALLKDERTAWRLISKARRPLNGYLRRYMPRRTRF